MILQAVLLPLLFFSEGYLKYATIGAFVLFNVLLAGRLLKKNWDSVDVLTIAAIICSIVFVIFYLGTKSDLTTIFGIALMLLFLVIAMLDIISQPVRPYPEFIDSNVESAKYDRIEKPKSPITEDEYYYEVEYPSVKSESKRISGKESHKISTTTAKAIAEELEREARKLESADRRLEQANSKYIQHEIYDTENELLRESQALESAQKDMERIKNAQAKKSISHELTREAQELMKVQKQIDANHTSSKKEIEKTAKKEDINSLKSEISKLIEAQKKIDEARIKTSKLHAEKIKDTASTTQQIQKNAATKDDLKSLKSQISEMISAQKKINKVEKTAKIQKDVKELKLEAAKLSNAQKKIDSTKKKGIIARVRSTIASRIISKKQQSPKKISKPSKKIETKKPSEWKREAQELMKVQKQINDIKKLQQVSKDAKSLKKAEKQIKEIKFLDRQEKIVKQASEIAKAQKEIDEMNKKTKSSIASQAMQVVPTKSVKSIVESVIKSNDKKKEDQNNKIGKTDAKKIIIKTIPVNEESFYFAAEGGNKFHEPGCMAIKNVPKNKLTLYTNKKDAMKKGLQPCNVCIPK
jgi:hypothetical protein